MCGDEGVFVRVGGWMCGSAFWVTLSVGARCDSTMGAKYVNLSKRRVKQRIQLKLKGYNIKSMQVNIKYAVEGDGI